jgi:hypothetical protein
MKILIWVHKNEAVSGKITKYYTTEPVSNLKDPDKYDTSYVQVQLTQDEFVQLEDINKTTSDAVDEFFNDDTGKLKDYVEKTNYREDSWRVKQFNRNRLHKDQINDVDEMDQNNQAFGD